ncbi:death domain-containing protein 1-like [Lineus longissimus]|uniref:death domain-containing protein 1-like n=1 Tax=Lineus longissimus TaxID=88925 RepID=UPI00315D17D3
MESNTELVDGLAENSTISGDNSEADDMVGTAENSGERNSSEQIRDGLGDGRTSSASKASHEVDVMVDRPLSGMSGESRDASSPTGEEGNDRELQEMFEGKEKTRVEDETDVQNGDISDVDETRESYEDMDNILKVQDENSREEDADAPSAVDDQFEHEKDRENVVETALLSEDVDMMEKFKLLKELIGNEHRGLRDQLLRNYEDVHTLMRSFEHSKNVLRVCKDYVKTLYCNVHDLSKEMKDLKVTLDKKMRTEGLTTMLDEEKVDKKDPEAVAEQSELLAKAAKAKTEIAEAEIALAEAIRMAAECKKEAAELEEEARAAEVKAMEHRRAVHETKKEVEKRRKELEEQKRQEAEKAKKKEEEDQKRREKDQKRKAELERIKGTPEEIEMLRKEEEQRRAEEERKDPQNWPKCIYTEKKPGDDDNTDPEIISIVRAMAGVLYEEDLVCEPLNQLDGILPLGENEELVSGIVQLKPASPDTVFPKCAEPWTVAIPHVAPRNNPIKEAVIKILDDAGTWTEVMTLDTAFSDITDKHFCECRVTGPVTLAVVLKIKKDLVMIGKKGGKYFSPLDSRVSLTVRPGVFRVTSTFGLKIQPVELGMVTEVKLRYPQVCENLFASSPIIHLGLKNKKFVKPMVATVPCPPNPARQKRPGTAGVGRDDKSDHKSRPKSAMVIGFHSFKVEEEPEDKLIMLKKEHTGPWDVKGLITHTQSKNKDIAVVELTEPVDRFMVLRLKADTPSTTAEDIATTIEKHINRRVVVCLLRQRSDDPSDVIITCTNINRIDRAQRKLNEAGYEDGPSPSKDIIVHEGQKLWINFRGNIRCMDKHASELEFAFNSHLNSSLRFSVAEVDQYAQKSSNMYRGFAQIYTHAMLQQAVKVEDKVSTKRNDSVKMELVQGEKLLSELLINLPKPDPEPPQPILKAPVQFKSDGVIDEALFRQLSADLGDEWKLLAAALSVKRARIQAILRDHVSNSDSEEAIYDMLVTWVKKIPRSMDKVEILCAGLITVGRTDLVEDIKDRERDWKLERANKAKEAKLKRAFLRVAQNQEVITDWRRLALVLGLHEDDIDGIEEGVIGSREQCHRALLLWKENDPLASINTLSRFLKKIKCRSAAEEIQQLA